MSNTQYNYFKGIAHVAQTKKPNSYGAFTVCLELKDEAEVEKYKKSGIQVDLSTDNKVWFKRPNQKLINRELVTLGPPRVLNTDGNDIDDLIGTGSEVVVKVRSYPTMKGTGHTLDAIQVIKLEKVERTSDGYHNF